jgi:hypothetical protein
MVLVGVPLWWWVANPITLTASGGCLIVALVYMLQVVPHFNGESSCIASLNLDAKRGSLPMVRSTPGGSYLANKDDGVGFGNFIHFGHGLLPGQRERYISAVLIMVGLVRTTAYIIWQNWLVSTENEHGQLGSLPKGMCTGLCMN